jgi:hypothetical protein
VPGTGTYTEDFSTTTYRGGATTAEGWGTGTLTSPRNYSIQLLDHYSTTYPVRGLDVQGRKAYITQYRPGTFHSTEILNISDPTNIQYMSHHDTNHRLITARVDGDLFMAGQRGGTLNFRNASNPHRLGLPANNLGAESIVFPVIDLEVQGHLLYVVGYGVPGQFVIFDITDPASRIRIASYSIGYLLGLDISGQFAYMAFGTSGFGVWNVSNPYSIYPVDGVSTPGNATDVIVDGHLAYIADGDRGIQIVDVSNPYSLTGLSSYDTPGNAERLALQGHTLYVADRSGGLQIVDVSDPTNPQNVTAITSLPDTFNVALYGGDVVVAAEDGVYTYRIGAGMTNLPLVGVLAGYDAWDVRVQGDIAYIAAGADGLVTVDVSDPTNPVFLDQHIQGTTPFYRKLDIQGNRVYVANFYYDTTWRALLIYNITDPTNLQYLGGRQLTWATDVFIDGEVAFVAVQNTGVQILNVSDYSAVPIIATVGGIPGNVTAIWVQGYHLYIAASNHSDSVINPSFFIYDITDLSNPARILQGIIYDDFNITYDVFVDGDDLLLPSSWLDRFSFFGGTVCLVNVTNPITWTRPRDYSSIFDPTWAFTGVWGFGPYILATSTDTLDGFSGLIGGIMLVNATNPHHIMNSSMNTNVNRALQVTVHGDYAYVANRTSLAIFRLFRSAASTYETSTVAQSTTVDSTAHIIENATLTRTATLPSGTSMTFELSADGGAHWEAVTPGVQHTFAYPGSDLRWRASLQSSYDDRTPSLTQVSINYAYNDPPSTPTITPLPAEDSDGTFTVSWSTCTDDSAVHHYTLVMSDTATFTTILDSWGPTGTSQMITGLSNGTYYFRVRAVDDDGVWGAWSATDSIVVAIPPTTPTTTPPPGIPGFPWEAIVFALVTTLTVVLLLRRRRSHPPQKTKKAHQKEGR